MSAAATIAAIPASGSVPAAATRRWPLLGGAILAVALGVSAYFYFAHRSPKAHRKGFRRPRRIYEYDGRPSLRRRSSPGPRLSTRPVRPTSIFFFPYQQDSAGASLHESASPARLPMIWPFFGQAAAARQSAPCSTGSIAQSRHHLQPVLNAVKMFASGGDACHGRSGSLGQEFSAGRFGGTSQPTSAES